jgi:hypothetical protein
VGRGKRLNCVVFGGFAAKNNAKRKSPLSLWVRGLSSFHYSIIGPVVL